MALRYTLSEGRALENELTSRERNEDNDATDERGVLLLGPQAAVASTCFWANPSNTVISAYFEPIMCERPNAVE